MRLIDADALIRKFKTASPMAIDGRARQMVEDMPTIEPERKKGEWIKGGEQPYFRKHFDIVVCSICNKRGEHRWNFCPNCGADCRGGQDD